MEERFGTCLGEYKGVKAYSNSKFGRNSGKNCSSGCFTGYKYQCVEYARRFMIETKQLTFDKIKCAYNIWDLNSFEHIHSGENFPFFKFPNFSLSLPKVDSMLIFDKGKGAPYGHVAIITSVNVREKHIKIAEQDEKNSKWKSNYSRKLKLEIIDGCSVLSYKYPIIGWISLES